MDSDSNNIRLNGLNNITTIIPNLRNRLDDHVRQTHETISRLQTGIDRFLHPEDYSDATSNTDSSSVTTANPIAQQNIIPPFSALIEPLHNPRHLGTLPFYFPRRIQNNAPATNINTLLMDIAENNVALDSISSEPPNQRRIFHQTTLHPECWDDFQATCDQIQPNELWGDNFLVKNDNTFRLYFQNLNSCGLSQGPDKWNAVLDSMVTAECDIMSFAQTSVNWKFLKNRNAMHQPVRQRMPISKLQVGRNKFDSDQRTLPGGVAQIIKGDWTSRVIETIQDPRLMGRWCATKFRLKHERNLYVFSAYRVCDQSLSQVGAETAFGQQDYMLSIDGIPNPNPRRQFIEDLVEVVKELQTGLDEFIIMLDAHEQLGSSAHGLTYLMRECHLIDLFHQHHGVCPAFTTYDSGHLRLDYAIGSSTLLPFINQCGYLPFYQGVSSDHRGLFLDLSMELIDGLTHLEHIPRRHLNSAFQDDVFHYKTMVNKLFIEHNIFERSERLYQRSGNIQQENSQFKEELETIDSLIVSIQLEAETKCCKLRTKFDYSDDIHFTKVLLNYWSIKRKRATKKKDVTAVLQQIYNTLPDTYRQYIDVSFGCSALRNWKKTKAKLKSLMAQHRKNLAQKHQEAYDNEAAFLGNTAEQVKLKHERKKRDKQLYTTLRQHFHPCTRSGISHLLVPDKDVDGIPTTEPERAHTWQSETSPSAILERLLERNIQHFGQAQGSPFTVPPLSNTFGYDGNSYQGTQLSQEGIMPPSLSNVSGATKDVLDRIGNETYRHPIANDLINFADFTSAIKKWRESTSTSPSGRHLGHYKSLVAIDSKSRYYTDDNPDPGLMILQVLYQIAASAFESGITLSRWTNITTCMIEKIPGTPRINKLRIIHLYEADYNLMNKLVWQRGVVWHAHTKGTLNNAQAGSRPYRTCIETVVSKDQKYLFSQLTCTNMGTMDNDAKSCYDRVVASLALMISHQFGVPETICQTVGETLKTMKFRLRTAMGDSSEYYHHTATTPVHGVGQGGTASPAFWLLISSALFDCHQKSATGMSMTDPTKTISLRQWLEALVDDTSIFTNTDNNQTPNDLVRALEKDAQTWENLLSVSGGCLELPKCFYYLLAWTFSQQGDPVPMSLPEISAITSPIQLQELGKTDSTPIHIKSPEIAHKTLGVYKSMTGDETEHVKYLTQRSSNLSSIVATSGLRPHQASVALRMIYSPAMGYSLPAVNLSEKILNKIQRKALESFTPALGYNRNFPREVLLGPKEYGGEGVPHLYTEAQIQKIEIIMSNIRANTDLGKLLCINLNWIQLLSGRSESILTSTYDIPYIKNWFMGVRSFLQEINAKIVFKHLYLPQLARRGDVCIMDKIAIAMPKLSANQERYINNWRLYYQVQTLSDLCTAKGDHILDIYLRKPSLSHINMIRTDRQSNLLWPFQPPPPSTSTFQLWVRYIRNCFLNRTGTKLRDPLGVLINTPNELQSTWLSYYAAHSKSLIIRTSTGLRRYKTPTRSTPGTTTYPKELFDIVLTIPDDYIPIDILETTDTYIARHSPRNIAVPSRVSRPLALHMDEAIGQIPSWHRMILQHFRIYDLELLISSLHNHDLKFFLVTDGGMKERRGSFGVAAGTLHHELFSIEGPVSGYDEHSNSFRREAFGMMAGFSFLSLFIKVYNISLPSTRSIYAFCDNLSLVRWVQKIIKTEVYPRMYIRSESDVILQIESDIKILQSLNVQIVLDHVKGHQDDHVPYDQLSREAQFNTMADEYATNFLREGTIPKYAELTANPISLYINDNVITRKLKHEIRNASCSRDLRKYMLKRFEWSDNIPDKIWWSVHGYTIKAYNSYDQRRIRKFIFGWLPTCRRMVLYGLAVCDKCPSCKDCTETHDHLIRCNCAVRVPLKSTWLARIDQFLLNNRYTPPIIRTILVDHINVLTTPQISTSYHTNSRKIIEAIADQQSIGWHHLLRGRLSNRWENIIADHLSMNNVGEKEMTAVMWGRIVIRHLFDLMLLLWKQRNEDGHLLTNQKESALTRIRLLQRIAVFKESNPVVSHHHRDFVYRSDDILSLYTNSNLRSWFKMAENLVTMYRKQRRRAPTDISTFWIHNADDPPLV